MGVEAGGKRFGALRADSIGLDPCCKSPASCRACLACKAAGCQLSDWRAWPYLGEKHRKIHASKALFFLPLASLQEQSWRAKHHRSAKNLKYPRCDAQVGNCHSRLPNGTKCAQQQPFPDHSSLNGYAGESSSEDLLLATRYVERLEGVGKWAGAA